jgi:hypothetical protein
MASTFAYMMISASSARHPSLSGRHSVGSWQPCARLTGHAHSTSAVTESVNNIPATKAREINNSLMLETSEPLKVKVQTENFPW